MCVVEEEEEKDGLGQCIWNSVLEEKRKKEEKQEDRRGGEKENEIFFPLF